MKKSVISFAIVALMAATLFAQINVSGDVVVEPAVEKAKVETNPSKAGEIQSNGSKSSGAGEIQSAGSKPFGFAISPDHSYGNVTVGYRFGKEDSSVPKQIVLGAEAKEMFRIGTSPVLLGLSVLGQARTNGNEFCVEYADLGASIGFEFGAFYFGVTPKVNIKTPKGLKLQLDVEFAPIDNCILYGYGLALINTDESNKNYVVSDSRWTEGSDRYQEYGAGFGASYQFNSGCFVSLDTGIFWTNNVFMTKDGGKTSLSWKTTVKAGGKKLAAVFSYECGGELTREKESVERFMLGMQAKGFGF